MSEAEAAGTVNVILTSTDKGFSAAMADASRKLQLIKGASATAGKATRESFSEARGGVAVLGEEIGVHLPRHIQTFIAKLPGVAPLMSEAFSSIAVVGIGIAIVDMGRKVNDFIRNVQKMPDAVGVGFNSLNLSATAAADAIHKSNDELSNQIAKLEGKPQNNLALALDESRIKADQLAASLEEDAKKVADLLEKNQIGIVGQLLGKGSTKDVSDNINNVNAEIAQDAQQAVDAQHGAHLQDAAAWQAKIAALRAKAIADLGAAIDKQQGMLDVGGVRQQKYSDAYGDQTENVKAERGEISLLYTQQDQDKSEGTNEQLQKKVNALTEAKEYTEERKRIAQQDIEQWREELEQDKSVQAMTLLQEAQFWMSKAVLTRDGAAAYKAAMNEANKPLALMKAQNFVAQQIFDVQGGGPVQGSDTPEQAKERVSADQYLDRSGSQENTEELRGQGGQNREYLANLNEQIRLEMVNKNAIAESALQMAVATGQMDKLSAAQAQAALHSQEFKQTMDAIVLDIQKVKDEMNAGTLTLAEGKNQISALAKQATAMQGPRDIQIVKDAQDIRSNQVGSGTREALDQMVQSWMDMTAQIKAVMTRAADSFNDDIVKAMTGQGKKGDFGKTFENAGQGLLKTGLQRVEGLAIGKLSHETSAKPTGTPSDRIYTSTINEGSAPPSGVASVSAPGAAGIPGHIFASMQRLFGGGAPAGQPDQAGGSQQGVDLSGLTAQTPAKKASGWQSVVMPLLHAGLGMLKPGAGASPVADPASSSVPMASSGGTNWLQPFQGAFAAGGDVVANRPALVGEKGPEVFMPHSAGRVIPNSKLNIGAGGDMHNHHYSVDARGSNDPAAVHAAVARALPHAVAASLQAVHQSSRRKPQGR